MQDGYGNDADGSVAAEKELELWWVRWVPVRARTESPFLDFPMLKLLSSSKNLNF